MISLYVTMNSSGGSLCKPKMDQGNGSEGGGSGTKPVGGVKAKGVKAERSGVEANGLKGMEWWNQGQGVEGNASGAANAKQL